MDIVKEFIKASLKEANRSEASVAYNSNITKAERLCIIITKTLNGKITERDWNHCFIEFNLPQNYKFLVRHYSGSGKEVCGVFEKCSLIKPDGSSPCYWNNPYNFSKEKDLESAKTCEEKYQTPTEVTLAVRNICRKIESIEESFRDDWHNLPSKYPSDDRKSTKTRKNLEKYKKEQAYYRDLFVKSKAIPEEDLAKYIISIKTESCDDGDWDDDSAKFNAKIAFILRDKTTKALYEFIYDVYFTAGAGGWYSPGSSWGYGYEPPDGESWLTGDVYDIEACCDDVQSDEPVNEEFEEHIMDILDKFCESGMLDKYIEDNLEDITGQDIR